MVDQVLDQIKTFLESNDIKVTRDRNCSHISGIAKGCIPIQPKNTKIDGDYFVGIYPDRVVEYGVITPYNYNDWRVMSTQTYETKEELLEIAKSFFTTPKAWA